MCVCVCVCVCGACVRACAHACVLFIGFSNVLAEAWVGGIESVKNINGLPDAQFRLNLPIRTIHRCTAIQPALYETRYSVPVSRFIVIYDSGRQNSIRASFVKQYVIRVHGNCL